MLFIDNTACVYYVVTMLDIFRSSDPNVHTQAIEGFWFRVKRWLPSSGRYNLQYYLPLFLWSSDCKRRQVNPFWELLSIISACDASKLFDVETEAVDTEVKISSYFFLIIEFLPLIVNLEFCLFA